MTDTRLSANASREAADADDAAGVAAAAAAAAARRSCRNRYRTLPIGTRRFGWPIVGYRKGCYRSSAEASRRGSSSIPRTYLRKRSNQKLPTTFLLPLSLFIYLFTYLAPVLSCCCCCCCCCYCCYCCCCCCCCCCYCRRRCCCCWHCWRCCKKQRRRSACRWTSCLPLVSSFESECCPSSWREACSRRAV